MVEALRNALSFAFWISLNVCLNISTDGRLSMLAFMGKFNCYS